MEFANHTLPAEHFMRLAAGDGNSGTLQALLGAEFSRRFLLLRILFDLIKSNPTVMDPLPPIDNAWDALEKTQLGSSGVMASVIMSPQIGVWLSRMVRILRTDKFDPDSMWTEVGYVHTLAFAVALRSRTSMTTNIPVRDGNAMIPTLGMAHFPLRGQLVATVVASRGRGHIRCAGHEVDIPPDPHRDGPGWWGLRRVALRFGGHALHLVLDDIDGYRNFDSPIPPRRLDEGSRAGWTSQLAHAWRILATDWPTQAEAMTAGFLSVTPLPVGDGREIRTASSGDGFGAALMSPHPDAVSLATSLVHEFQHIKLGSLIHLIPLVEPEPEAGRHQDLVYAPWRDDPRPVPGLLQGVYAFAGIAEFWCRHRATALPETRALADFEFAYARRQARQGLTTVLGSPLLTDRGREFGNLLARHFRDHLTERLPAPAAQAAWAVATDHHAAWRIRHLQPDPARTTKLVDAYLAGAAPHSVEAVPSSLGTAEKSRWYQSRLALYRLRLTEPEAFAALAAGRGAMPPQALGAVPADLLLVAGDPAGAQEGYLAAIADDPGSIAGWTGLTITACALGSTGAWRVLLRRPELVRAVYREARRAATRSPIALAQWLDQAPTTWLSHPARWSHPWRRA
jgi:HEXXH motif-containing protein